jgi:hypothetical protein
MFDAGFFTFKIGEGGNENERVTAYNSFGCGFPKPQDIDLYRKAKRHEKIPVFKPLSSISYKYLIRRISYFCI